MKTMHRLNGHKIEALADAVSSFLTNEIGTEAVIKRGENGYTVTAQKETGILDKLSGDDKGCNIEFVEDGLGSVKCTFSGEHYLGKVLAAGAILPSLPATCLVDWAALTYIAKNFAEQVALPKKTDDFIKEYLASNT